MLWPIGIGTEHACVISFRIYLREHHRAPHLDPARIASGVLNAVGGVVSKVPTLKLGDRAIPANLYTRDGYGTCDRSEATVIIVTEEGSGRCFYYPYSTQAAADVYFDSRTWMPISRIMFRSAGGCILEEIRQGGFSFPYKTIR